jgi:tetratricopeptide (TPR) repeat protein
VKRALLAAGLMLVAVRPGHAQVSSDAEDAFRRGDYRAARAAYDRMLAADSLNVRALYRLAILDSWDGALARSLERFRRLRAIEPRDADIMVANARVLSWAGRHDAAVVLFDSVLAVSPNRADALAGRARTIAWSGDLARAEQLWRDALALYPDDPRPTSVSRELCRPRASARSGGPHGPRRARHDSRRARS